MSSPRGDKPAPSRPSLDGGPSFDADSLVVPDEVHREGMGGGRRPQKRRTSLPGWVIPVGAGLVLVLGLAFWLVGRSGGSSSKVEPIADPEPSAGVVASPSPSPSASAIPSPSSAARATAAPSHEATPSAEPEPSEAAAVKEPHAPGHRGKAKSGQGKSDPAKEEAVDDALARLSQKSGPELKQEGKLDAARLALVRECDDGKGASCELLAGMAERGEGGERDPRLVKEAHEKGCAARSAAACLAVGDSLLADPATRQAAAEKLALACSYASAAGCRRAAELLEQNHDAAADAKAISFRARACALGDKDSCAKMKAATSSAS